MKPTITVELLPRLGDRLDYRVEIVGPGDTKWITRVSLTGTVIAIWDTDPNEAALELSRTIFSQMGTTKEPPVQGFWFDSYNSGDTVKNTCDLIRNKTWKSYVKDGYEEPYVNKFGSEVLRKIDMLNMAYAEKHGKELFRSLDDAFEISRAREDLDILPKDQAHFVYRVCILSVIIDHFNLFIVGFDKKNGTISGLEAWLQENGYDESKVKDALSHFRMIKKLRKQYPIHEQYTVTAEGIRSLRKELIQAQEYYKLDDNKPTEDQFHRVIQDFMIGLIKLEALVN